MLNPPLPPQIGRGRGGGRLLLTLAKCQHSFSGVHTGDGISRKLHLCKLYYICIHVLIRQTKDGGIWVTLLKIQMCFCLSGARMSSWKIAAGY